MGWGDFTSDFWSGAESIGQAHVDFVTGSWDDAVDNLGAGLQDWGVLDEPDRRPPPQMPDFGEFDMLDPFESSDEFSKGVKKAKASSSLGKEQLLQDFVAKHSITAGDFSTGAGVAF